MDPGRLVRSLIHFLSKEEALEDPDWLKWELEDIQDQLKTALGKNESDLELARNIGDHMDEIKNRGGFQEELIETLKASIVCFSLWRSVPSGSSGKECNLDSRLSGKGMMSLECLPQLQSTVSSLQF